MLDLVRGYSGLRKMSPKRIISPSKEEYEVEKKRYSKPREWVQPEWITQYYLERDRVIYRTTKDEQTKIDILERYNVKK